MIKVPRIKTAKELLGNLGGVKRLPRPRVRVMAEGGEVEEEMPEPSAVRGSRARNVFESVEMGSSKSMGMALGSLGEMKGEKGRRGGGDTARAQLDDVLRQLKVRERGVQNAAKGLARDTFGAPTLEGPTLTKASLTRRSFAEGGDVSRETMSPEEQPVTEESSASKALKRLMEPVREGARGYFGLEPGDPANPTEAYRTMQALGNMSGAGAPGAIAAGAAGLGSRIIPAAKRLLLMPCSDMKCETPAAAKDLYKGVFYQTYNRQVKPGAEPHMMILSAKHGFVTPKQMLEPYNQKMTPQQAQELVSTVKKSLEAVEWPTGIEEVMLVGGKHYQRVMNAAVDELKAQGKIPEDVVVRATKGEIGQQRQQLGEYLRGIPSGEQGSVDDFIVQKMKDGGEVQEGDARTYLDEIEARDDPIRSGRPLQQRTRRPATLEENQAMSRAVMQGVANMPYNLLGAPGDIANLLAAPTGRQPFYGSEAVKDFATRIGVRPAPPTDPTQAFLYGAGDIGSALVNPAAPVRAAARGAQAVGEGLSAAAKDFQAYNQALSVPGASYAVKQRGGNWINESVEEFVKPLKRSVAPFGFQSPEELMQGLAVPRETAQQIFDSHLGNNKAINNWIDKNLVKYIKNEMATPEDPLLALAEREGISTVPRGPMSDLLGNINAPYNRSRGGMPTGSQAVSAAGRKFENVADASIEPGTYISHLPINTTVSPSYFFALNRTQLRQLGGEFAVENPGARAYAMSGSTTPGDLGLDHMVDVLAEDLASGRMTPKDLNKLSMEGAARRVAQYDEELRAAMEKAKLAQREGFPLYKAYPQGYRWHELNKPGSFAMESDAMGNSVRGYEPPKGHPDWVKESGNKGSSSYGLGGWEAIKGGKAKVYSLTDSSGKSIANIEWGAPSMSQADAVAQAQQEGLRGQEFAFRVADLMEGKGQAGVIHQIKGPGNMEVPDEALPFVQDFITSQNWTRIVRDAEKAGLRPAQSVFNDQEMAKIRAAGLEIPQHGLLTGEQIQTLHNAITPENMRLTYDARGNIVSDPYSRGYAHGGPVNKHAAFIKAKS